MFLAAYPIERLDAQTVETLLEEMSPWVRSEWVYRALNAGWTHARIAYTIGVSRGRIAQIRAAGEGPA